MKGRKYLCADIFFCAFMFDFTNVSAAFFLFWCQNHLCYKKKLFLQFRDMQMTVHGVQLLLSHMENQTVFTDI